MKEQDESIETGWAYATVEIPARGLDIEREASAVELASLATALDILAVERLTARYRIAPRASGRFRLTGTIEARISQACVVTLDPVVSDIVESLDAEFRPDGDLPAEAAEEQEALAAAEYEPIEQHKLAVGRVILETLAAALPPYPRAPDAALDHREKGPDISQVPHPFGALAGWKPRPK